MRFYTILAIAISVQNTLAFVLENEDTVVIDAAPENGGESRGKRQFPFQFPTWPKYPSFPAPTRPSCYASTGDAGECVTMKQCFPILYSSLETGQEDVIQNPNLAEMLRNASGPCNSPVMGNYFYFKADAEVRQNLVCCSQLKRPSYYPPRTTTTPFPLKPPMGIKLTTRRPGISFPNPPTTGIKLTTRRPGISLPKPPTAPPQSQKPPVVQVPPSDGSSKIDTPSSCGISKVVGGATSAKGRHPWIVALTNNGRQFCGGSLISKNFVLTAAHCVSHMRAADINRIRVHLGEHTLGVGENTEQFEKVTRVLYHRGFSHQTLHNDIALLKLGSPARETQYIQPVCLSQSTRSLQDSTVTLAGWGQVQDGGPQAGTLREVNMKVWSLESCSAKYGPKAPAGILSSMVCAGSPGKDACRGDSGGPLTMRNSRNVYEQIGVVSWGIGCGTYPGVYTKVAAFLPWIDKNRRL